jgi:hypothetical protein
VNPVPKLEEEEDWSCISWQLVPVPDGLREERISEFPDMEKGIH